MSGTSFGVICMAVYRPNTALLRVQIDSIKKQTVRDWKCIVGVDGVDRNAVDTVRQLTMGDERFTVREFADNVGFYRNFERLLGLVPHEASWVALADQDDDWFPTKLEILIPHLNRASLITGQALIATPASDTGKAKNITRRWNTGLLGMLIDNQVTGSLCIFRRDVLDRALPFPPATDAAFHDHWLAVCALVADGVIILDRAVQDYVQHSDNIIGEAKKETSRKRLNRLLTAADMRTVRAALDYLSENRWRWRTNMARQAILTADATALRSDDRATLELFASDRCTPALMMKLATAVVGRRAPLLRTCALAAGAVNEPSARKHRATLASK